MTLFSQETLLFFLKRASPWKGSTDHPLYSSLAHLPFPSDTPDLQAEQNTSTENYPERHGPIPAKKNPIQWNLRYVQNEHNEQAHHGVDTECQQQAI